MLLWQLFPPFLLQEIKKMKSCFTEKLEDSVLCQTWYKVQICKTSEPTLDLYEETVVSVTLPCPTLFDPMDCSPLGSSVHGISQARILEWVAISFSRGSSWPRDQTHISCTGRWILYHWATREAPMRKLRLTEIKCFSWVTQLIESTLEQIV